MEERGEGERKRREDSKEVVSDPDVTFAFFCVG